KRHGNLSLFVLPAAIISIFSALYFAAVILHNIIITMIEKIAKFSAIDFRFNFQNWAIDWFYLHTESLFVLSIVLAALTISLILIGKYLADRKVSFSKDILFFILFYSFLAPWWLAKAVYNTLLSRKTAWR
ncbi:MAG: hypothetical protein AAB906_00670, partial [Patescibacteria group bacterium]